MNICIVAHFAYGAMSGGDKGHAGGVERQTSLTAKWLAARGHKVSILTWDEGGPKEEIIDNVRVIKMCAQDSGIPIVRFFIPRWTSLISALRKADADVYYQNCGEYITGQVALWCQMNNKKFVFSTANDIECKPELEEFHNYRERILYKYGIRHADSLIVQTDTQASLMKGGFGLDSVVMPMPCPGPDDDAYISRDVIPVKDFTVLWVARIHESKRLEVLLSIARKLPEIQFYVAGKPKDINNYIENVMKEAESIENVHMLGMVSRANMPDLYRKSSVLCCTSLYEGFPNTFLEAWSHGTPIVSTFDPDNLINKKTLGVSARNEEDIINGLIELRDKPEFWNECSKNSRSYYIMNHSVDAVMETFEGIIEETIKD